MPDNNPPPNDDEPTRIGGQPPQRPPIPPQPAQQQPPQQQPPQSPFPQQPYQPPQQPYPQQGFPPQGPPQAGQNPYGQPPGQYPPGQYPPPYGPGGPGGPGGYGPPKRTGLKVGLILGAAVLLIAAVTTVAVITVKNMDDDGGTQATDPDVSATTSPSGTPSEPASDAPTDVPSASGAGTGAPASESFKAEYGFQTGQVCSGMAMTNASPYNPSKPKVTAYANNPGNEDEFYSQFVGFGKPWEVEYNRFKDVSVVACLRADPATAKPAATCAAKDSDGKKFKYTLSTVDYTLTFVEATTGSQLGGQQTISGSSNTCPAVMFLPEGEDFYVSPDYDVLEPAVDDFVG